jgi:hypothetical protein
VAEQHTATRTDGEKAEELTTGCPLAVVSSDNGSILDELS